MYRWYENNMFTFTLKWNIQHEFHCKVAIVWLVAFFFSIYISRESTKIRLERSTPQSFDEFGESTMSEKKHTWEVNWSKTI